MTIATIQSIFTTSHLSRLVEPPPTLLGESDISQRADLERMEGLIRAFAATQQPITFDIAQRTYKFSPVIMGSGQNLLTPWEEAGRRDRMGGRQVRLTCLHAGLTEQTYPANQVPVTPMDLRGWFISLDRHLPRTQQTPALEYIETVSPLTSEHSDDSRTSGAIRGNTTGQVIDDVSTVNGSFEQLTNISGSDILDAVRGASLDLITGATIAQVFEHDIDDYLEDEWTLLYSDNAEPLSSATTDTASLPVRRSSRLTPRTISVSSASVLSEESGTII